MPIRSFREFLGGKKREAQRQLHMVMKVLEQSGFKVEDHLEQFDEPYIFCYNPNKDTSFKGIRLYKIGDQIAYRVQRESKTHPFGTAYMIDMDGIFNDLMGDGVTKKEELGRKVMEEVAKTLRNFFQESAQAEKQEDQWDDDAMGQVHVRNALGGDYSSQVTNSTGSGR
jgi:GGDEF domain-containing protein